MFCNDHRLPLSRCCKSLQVPQPSPATRVPEDRRPATIRPEHSEVTLDARPPSASPRMSATRRLLALAVLSGAVLSSGALVPVAGPAFAQGAQGAAAGGAAAAGSPAQPPAHMAAPPPVAKIEPVVGGLFSQRIAIEDERLALSMAAAAVDNRARFIEFMNRARLSGIVVDDIPLPNATQTMLTQADAHAQRQSEAADRAAARERAAKDAADRAAAEPAATAPHPGGHSPTASAPLASAPRLPSQAAQVTDDTPRWMTIVGVSPRLFATIMTSAGVDTYSIGDRLPNGWTLTAVSHQNGVTGLDRAGTPHKIEHINAVR